MTLILPQFDVVEFFQIFDNLPYDEDTISQEKLDLHEKQRMSLFPWRGQFSPELVEIFLKTYSNNNSVIFDPFVGSGTTVFEAGRKNLTCFGVEINPSAIEMAKTAHFMNIQPIERKRYLREAESIIKKYIKPSRLDLFTYLESQKNNEDGTYSLSLEESFKEMLHQVENDTIVHNIISNSMLRYKSSRKQDDASGFNKAFFAHSKLVERLPFSQNPCQVIHSDARNTTLISNSVDLVITSPPYINVFNYHQNNRPTMELIGWDLLQVAKSEIGSNRKHRQNRFLTVIQYALDMAEVLKEIKRLLKPDSRAIIVVGKESSVRGVSFNNGKLVAAVAVGTAGFNLVERQQRKFKNKFGEIIYEEILHLQPTSQNILSDEGRVRDIAITLLSEALKLAENEVQPEINDAIVRAKLIQPSPLFKLENYRNLNNGHEVIVQ